MGFKIKSVEVLSNERAVANRFKQGEYNTHIDNTVSKFFQQSDQQFKPHSLLFQHALPLSALFAILLDS